MVAVSVTLTGAPKLITAVPAAETVPNKLMLEGAVAVTPPVNAVVLVFSALIVKVPVLLNVAAPVMLLLAPLNETL